MKNQNTKVVVTEVARVGSSGRRRTEPQGRGDRWACCEMKGQNTVNLVIEVARMVQLEDERPEH